MNFESMILSVGTALRRAQEAGMTVHVLVGGLWMTGRVTALDGEGVVITSAEGDTTVMRIQGVVAVRVEPMPTPLPTRAAREPYDLRLPAHAASF
jgi:hypothetical protein